MSQIQWQCSLRVLFSCNSLFTFWTQFNLTKHAWNMILSKHNSGCSSLDNVGNGYFSYSLCVPLWTKVCCPPLKNKKELPFQEGWPKNPTKGTTLRRENIIIIQRQQKASKDNDWAFHLLWPSWMLLLLELT